VGDVNGDGFGDVVETRPAQGSAVLFFGASTGPEAAPGFTITGDAAQLDSQLGGSVASAGDVNGDGLGDLLIGASLFDSGAGVNPDAGRALLYLGKPDGAFEPTPAWHSSGGNEEKTGARFGIAIGSGDFNGDGFSDVLIGSTFEDSTTPGRVFVFFGSKSAPFLPDNASWVSTLGGAINDFYGGAVGSAGDVNGDGIDDLFVGARGYVSSGEPVGKVFVFHGSKSGLPRDATWSASGSRQSSLGASVSSAGDVNGDGFFDLVVGAPGAGQVYAYFGSRKGLPDSPGWTGNGAATDLFGSAVAGGGDVTGDGFDDLLVGVPGFRGGAGDTGQVLLFPGSPAGPSSALLHVTGEDRPSARFGAALAIVGDVTGDTVADFLVGAPGMEERTGDGKGKVFLYAGGPSLKAPMAASWSAFGPRASGGFGLAVSRAGDVGGDGFSDFWVGAPLAEGSAHLFRGAGGRGVSRSAAQIDDGGAVIAAHGISGSRDGVRLRLHSRSHLGSTKVKLQLEVKPLDRPFDGTGTGQSGGFVSTGLEGQAIEAAVTGLSDETGYHWRARVRAFPSHGGRWVVPSGGLAGAGTFHTPPRAGADAGADAGEDAAADTGAESADAGTPEVDGGGSAPGDGGMQARDRSLVGWSCAAGARASGTGSFEWVVGLVVAFALTKRGWRGQPSLY
jgi:hypothetical protein